MDDLETSLLQTITSKAWQKVGAYPHHGINLPLSALHTKDSCGIGEFFDLIPMIDWCEKLGLDVIQLLPLNNSEGDPSPYNGISSCAINFAYLSLHLLPHIEKLPELQEKLSSLRVLNQTERISYLEVQTHKLNWLRGYYDEVGRQIIATKAFEKFIAENPWVKPFSLYKALKTKLGNTPSSSWPPELQPPLDDALYELYAAETGFHQILQYLCYVQFKEVKEYARQKKIFLMGDIPILISRESADVWLHPEYFHLDFSAGAPPDYYTPEGQNWGFPIFRWDALRKKRFDWWTQRLQYAQNFYDLFRIDHVIGFFRIFAIPLNYSPKEGSFIPAEEREWEPQGREILTMIASATEMLPIAEDLGVVPDCVRPVLADYGICSTKVMHWENAKNGELHYTPIQYYPPISLTTLSTHDSETTPQWWEKFPDEATAFAHQKRWEYTPRLSFDQHLEILWDSHHTSSLFHINLLQEYLALFPELVHSTPAEERINIPGLVLPSNWTYRFKPSVEQLTSHEELFATLKKIIHSPTPQ